MDPVTTVSNVISNGCSSSHPISNGHYPKVTSKANQGIFKPRKLSYLSVPGEYPLSDKTVGELVDDAAELYGSSEGLYDRAADARLTFRDIKEESDVLAAGFLRLGFAKGDRVGIVGPNSRRWYITHVALAKVGIIVVNVNPALSPQEILYCINKVTMKGIVVADKFKDHSLCDVLRQALPELSESQEPGRVISERAPSLTIAITMEAAAPYKSMLTYDHVMENGRGCLSRLLEQAKCSVSFDDIFCILFTSGTTGSPKGVVLTHHNAVNNCEILGRRLELTAQDKVCLFLQMFHIYGTIFGVLAGLRYGVGLVLPSPVFDPVAATRAVLEERCTWLYGTPTLYIDMMAVIEKGLVGAPTTLKKVVTSGACCPVELIRQMKSTFRLENVIECYGMTEMADACTLSLPGDSDELRANTVGYPVEHFEVKIVNEMGETVPVGVPGELCARSCTIMQGYWGDEEKTRQVIDKNRWFHTGDLFVMEPSGHCRIVGRMKEMIVSGGENISPAEIENLLQSHPAIMEVHTFGVQDTRLGEQVAAWIRLQEGEDLKEEELRLFCKGKISVSKIPKHIKFTAEFPKTVSGKIQKYQMQMITAKELGLC